MECTYLIWFLLTISLVNTKTITLKILPDGKARNLIASSDNVDGIEETQWILETQADCKIRVFCTIKVKDCLKATLTIDNGKSQFNYCGRKAVGHILHSSDKNKMVVNLMTRNVPPSSVGTCLASAIKSFIDFEEPIIDSSEAGVKAGPISTTCPCGWSTKNNARIVGGREAQINEFSFPAIIVRKDKKIAFCGGSVITEYHILTAAHCTYKLKENVPLLVGIGEHNLASAKETNATQFIPVEKIIRHENFTGESKIYDISILVLEKPIIFNKLVGPVCLPNKRIDIEEQFVKVMGWGRLSDRGFQSEVLMKVDLKVIDFTQCPEFYKKLKLEEPHQFCTYGHDKDTCSGDSGGPVVWLDPDTNRYTQVGLVSYGRGCATDVPGVNTDIFYFIDWIHKIIDETKSSVTCTKSEMNN